VVESNLLFNQDGTTFPVNGTVFARTNDSLCVKWTVTDPQGVEIVCEADLNYCGTIITNGRFTNGTFTGHWCGC
jgi:hypothetical protein